MTTPSNGIRVTSPGDGGIRISPGAGGGIRVTTPGALGFSPVGGVFGGSPQPPVNNVGFSLVGGGSPTPPSAFAGGRPRIRVTTPSSDGIRIRGGDGVNGVSLRPQTTDPTVEIR